MVLATAASVASALVLREVAVDGALPGDAALERWVDPLLSVHDALWVSAFTSSAMVTPLLVAVAILAARARRWERALLAVLTYVASKLIALPGWWTWSRTRPGDVADGLLIPEGLASYPSGHAVQTITVYGLLALWWTRSTDRAWERALAWVLLMALLVAVGLGRVRIGAHYPSDILGGAVLGGVWLAGVALAERALGRQRRAEADGPRPHTRARA